MRIQVLGHSRLGAPGSGPANGRRPAVSSCFLHWCCGFQGTRELVSILAVVSLSQSLRGGGWKNDLFVNKHFSFSCLSS